MKDMLHNDVHIQGVLMHLAQPHPDEHFHVGNIKNSGAMIEAADTPQTLALGRLAGVNDAQMGKLHSFLRHIGNTELKLKKREANRIGKAVGLDAATPTTTTFGSFALEWATASGTGIEKPKKPQEHCNFWNADILVEVAAEIDLVYHTMSLESGAMMFAPLDCRAPGFSDN